MDYESNETLGMPSFVSKAGGNCHERLNQCDDDILLHSRIHFEHREQLEKLLIRLINAGLKVNLAKCEFGAKNVSCLG